MPEKRKVIDVQGSEIVTAVLLKLLNDFPGLHGNKIEFSTLYDKSGIGFFPTTGAVLLTNKKSITGSVFQTCGYPFNIVYRAAPRTGQQKVVIKEFLDTLGKWLERQPIAVEGEQIQLHEYPKLDNGRKITSISRTAPGHLDSAYQDGTEDWLISLELKYEHEYEE